jgi:hypothetical protein
MLYTTYYVPKEAINPTYESKKLIQQPRQF